MFSVLAALYFVKVKWIENVAVQNPPLFCISTLLHCCWNIIFVLLLLVFCVRSGKEPLSLTLLFTALNVLLCGVVQTSYFCQYSTTTANSAHCRRHLCRDNLSPLVSVLGILTTPPCCDTQPQPLATRVHKRELDQVRAVSARFTSV